MAREDLTFWLWILAYLIAVALFAYGLYVGISKLTMKLAEVIA